jgi:hypothetical protein
VRRNARPGTEPAKLEADVLAAVNKSRSDNREILRYLGATQEDWPATSVFAKHAVFEVDLEAQLRETWPAWEQSRRDLVTSGAGFPGKHGPTYRRATVDAPEKAPDVFQEILAEVRSLRYGGIGRNLSSMPKCPAPTALFNS